MAGKTLDKARRDAKKYVTKGGFHEDINMETVDGSVSVDITGFVSKHWINYDTDGSAVNSKNAHICIDEDALIKLNYPVRNQDDEVYLMNHRVKTTDSTGSLKSYLVKEWFPDESLGLIVCILSDYEPN